GMVIFDGTGTQTLNSGGVGEGCAFNNFTYSGSGILRLLSNHLDVNGNFVLASGIFDTNSLNQYFGGNFQLNPGTTYIKSGILTFNGQGSSTWTDLTTTKQDIGNVVIDGAATLPGTGKTISTTTNVKASSVTIGSDDTLDITDDTLTLTSTGIPLIVNTGGVFTTTNSTVVYAGSGSNTNIAAVKYHNLILNPSSLATYLLTGDLTGSNALTGNLTIEVNAVLDAGSANNYDLTARNITIASGAAYQGRGSTITLSGNWTNNDTFAAGTSTVIFNGTSTQLLNPGASSFYNLTISNTSIRGPPSQDGAQIADSLTVTNNLTLSSNAILGLRDKNLNAAGAVISNQGTIKLEGSQSLPNFVNDPAAGTIEYYGNYSYPQLVAGDNYYSLIFSGSGNYNLDNPLDVQGNLIISSGRLTTGNNSINIEGNITNSGILTLANNMVNIAGNWTNIGGTFIAGTSTVIFDGISTIITGGIADTQDFNDVVISGTANLSTNPIDINGSLEVTGSFDTSGLDIYLAGNWTNQGTFTHSSGTVVFDGAASSTLISGGSSFYDLAVNKTSGAILTLQTDPVIIENSFTITFGELIQAEGINLTTGDVIVEAAGKWTNISDGDVTLSGNVSNSGIITFNGVTALNGISITSSAAGAQRNWQGQGVFSMADVDVRDQACIGGVPPYMEVTDGTDSGNNINWFFKGIDELAGIAYKDEGVSPIDENLTIKLYLAYNTGSKLNLSAIASLGEYFFSGLDIDTGDVVTLYIDDHATYEATTSVRLAGEESLTDLDLYNDVVIMRAETGAISNNDLNNADSGDDDIKYNVLANNFTIDSGFKLLIWQGDVVNLTGNLTVDNVDCQIAVGAALNINANTFNLTTGGTLNNDGTLNITTGLIDLSANLDNFGAINIGDGSINLAGNWSNQGIFNAQTSTVTLSGITSSTLVSGESSFYDLIINKTDSDDANDNLILQTNDAIVTNSLTITNGELIQNGRNFTTGTVTVEAAGKWTNISDGDVTLSGDVSNSGIITFNGVTALNGISITSSAVGTQRNWQAVGGGVFNMTDVDIRDQACVGGVPPYIEVTDGTDSGNNVNWFFKGTDSIAGIIYADEGITAIVQDVCLTLYLYYETTSRLTLTTTTIGTANLGDGSYSFNNLDLDTQDVAAVYINDSLNYEATTSSNFDDAVSPANFNLYHNDVIIRSDSTTPISNTALNNADDGDMDIHYSITGGNLSIDSGYKLLVWGGDTFTPGGNVTVTSADMQIATGAGLNLTTYNLQLTTSGSLDNDGILTLTTGTVDLAGSLETSGTINAGGGLINLEGNWVNSGTFTAGTSTVVFDGISVQTLDSGADAFYDLTISNTSTLGVEAEGSDLIVGDNLTISADAVLDLKDNNLIVNGPAISNEGTLKLTGSQTQTIFTNDPNSGTVEYSGDQTYSGLAAGDNYYDLTLNSKTGSGKWILDSLLDIDNDLTIDSGSLSAGNNFINIAGNWKNQDTFDSGTGTVIFDGDDTQKLDSGGTGEGCAFNNLVHSGSGTLVLTDNPLDVDGDFILSAGSFDANGQDQHFGGNFQLDSGTTYISGGTLTFDGTGASTIIDSTTSGTPTGTGQNLGDVVIDGETTLPGTGKIVSTLSNIKVTSVNIGADDTLDITGDTLTLTGTGVPFTVNTGGTFVTTDSTVVYASSGADTNITQVIYNNLILNPTSATTYLLSGSLSGSNALTGDLTIKANATLDVGSINNYDLTANNITINQGSYSAYNSTITVSENWTNQGGSFNSGTSTVIFNATDIDNAITSGLSSFYNLEFTGFEGKWSLQDDLVVDDNLTISQGTLAAGNNSLTIAGNWANNIGEGGFDCGNSIVTFVNSDKPSQIQGATIFNDFICTTPGKLLIFQADFIPPLLTYIIKGRLILRGAAKGLIKLRSMAEGEQWNINPQGSRDVSFVDVRDSNNLNAAPISAYTSCDRDNNTNWIFSVATLIWDGSISVDWAEDNNWQYGYVPNKDDNVIVADAVRDPILDKIRQLNNLTINTGGILDLNNKGLIFSGNFTNHGTLKLQGEETFTNFFNDTTDGTVEYYGDKSYSRLIGGDEYYNLRINSNAGGIYTLANPLDVQNNLELFAGTLDVSSSNHQMNIGGSFRRTLADFIVREGTVVFDTNQTGKTITSGQAHFYNLKFDGAGSWSLADDLFVDNDIAISQGALSAGSRTLTVTGNWANTAGSSGFIPQTSTIIFNASDTDNMITSGGATF
ncbi:MAG: hypothetical protein KJ711_08445, partial [Candidatus Omnitrophica bacterium]|nr:hypothetical protein [Candidatus Omnitrophota bacterium]